LVAASASLDYVIINEIHAESYVLLSTIIRWTSTKVEKLFLFS
jgi:hypothetical protein